MKACLMTVALALAAATHAAPLRVAVLDFQDQSGMKSDAELGGLIAPGALADKGVFLLGKALAGREGFSLVDRRDFILHLKATPETAAGGSAPRPSFLQAAQVVRADAVLRGSLQSLSVAKQAINQGGFQAENSVLTLRVGLEALDVTDGSVIAAADGANRFTVRQTAALKTVLSEDDVLQMMEKALGEAVPAVEKALRERQERLAARPRVKLNVSTTEQPALVELDGVLIGASPVQDFSVYAGDHVLRVTRPGYREVNKRILLEKDTSIEIPMLRYELTAEELKQIYEKGQLNIIQSTEPGLILHTIETGPGK